MRQIHRDLDRSAGERARLLTEAAGVLAELDAEVRRGARVRQYALGSARKILDQPYRAKPRGLVDDLMAAFRPKPSSIIESLQMSCWPRSGPASLCRPPV